MTGRQWDPDADMWTEQPPPVAPWDDPWVATPSFTEPDPAESSSSWPSLAGELPTLAAGACAGAGLTAVVFLLVLLTLGAIVAAIVGGLVLVAAIVAGVAVVRR